MLTKELTKEEQNDMLRAVANSIRTDWQRYDQYHWVVKDGSQNENEILANMVFDEDKNPVCGASACIAGRAVIIGIARGYVKQPVKLADRDEDDNWYLNRIGVFDFRRLGIQLMDTPMDIFESSFNCLTNEEEAEWLYSKEDDRTKWRRINAYRIARMLDELADGKEDAYHYENRTRAIELPPEPEPAPSVVV